MDRRMKRLSNLSNKLLQRRKNCWTSLPTSGMDTINTKTERGQGISSCHGLQCDSPGCLPFLGGAWKEAARNQWSGWDDKQKRRNPQRITIDSRLFFLPRLRITNPVGFVLTPVLRQGIADWQGKDGIRPMSAVPRLGGIASGVAPVRALEHRSGSPCPLVLLRRQGHGLFRHRFRHCPGSLSGGQHARSVPGSRTGRPWRRKR